MISEMTAQMHEAVIKVVRRAARAARRRPPPEETEFITIVMTGDGSRWYSKLLDHLDLLLANTHAMGPDLTVEMTLQICTHCDMIYDGIRMSLLSHLQPRLH